MYFRHETELDPSANRIAHFWQILSATGAIIGRITELAGGACVVSLRKLRKVFEASDIRAAQKKVLALLTLQIQPAPQPDKRLKLAQSLAAFMAERADQHIDNHKKMKESAQRLKEYARKIEKGDA